MPVTTQDIIDNAAAIADLINGGTGSTTINIADLDPVTSLSDSDLLHVSVSNVDKNIQLDNLQESLGKVKVDSIDTSGYLEDKVEAGAGISINKLSGSFGDYLEISGSGGGLESENVTTTTKTISVGKKYVSTSDGSTRLEYTLPSVASIGDGFAIIGKVDAGWKICQNSGQTIHQGSSSSEPGEDGYLLGYEQYSCAELICVVANTEFVIEDSEGVLFIAGSWLGTTAGYSIGGFTGSATHDYRDKLTYATEASARVTSWASVERYSSSGGSGDTTGVISGNSSYSDDIDYFDYATDGGISGTASNALNTGILQAASVSASTKCYFCGGDVSGGANTDIIQDIVYSTRVSTDTTLNLASARNAAAGAYNNLHGYIMGGDPGTPYQGVDKIVFSGPSQSNLGNILSIGVKASGAFNGPTKAYNCGGNTGSLTSNIEGILFATDTFEDVAANIKGPSGDQTLQQGVGVSSAEKGYLIGGDDGISYEDEVTSLVFADESTAFIGSDLPAGTGGGAAVQD